MKNEKIIEAIETIKKCCEEATDCCMCPLGDKDNGCGLDTKTPKDFEIKGTEIFKVFL